MPFQNVPSNMPGRFPASPLAIPPNPRRQIAASAALLACCLLTLTACAQRRITITSDPPGALVHLNDVEVGRTPVEVDFTYFGVYDVRLNLAGYEPISTARRAAAPPHEWPGLDLIFLLLPMRTETLIDWHFELEPADADPEKVLQRALQLRERLGDEKNSKAAEEGNGQ